jgi:hypothetical protein
MNSHCGRDGAPRAAGSPALPLAACLLLALPAAAAGQEPLPPGRLSVQAAVGRALAHYPTVKAAAAA